MCNRSHESRIVAFMFTKRQLDGWRGYWALATSGNCCYYIIASLVGLYPTLGWQHSDGKQLTHLGASLALLKDDSGDSLEKRFVALLNAHVDDLPEHLRQAISLLKSKDKPVNWLRLLRDLKQWDREDRRVQRLWAKGFWRT